jgi:hypothetical protein
MATMSAPAATETVFWSPASRPAVFTNEPVSPMSAPRKA